MILAWRLKRAGASAMPALGALSSLGRTEAMAEQRFEKIAVLGGVGAGEPPFRNSTLRSSPEAAKCLVCLPVTAEPIVRHTFFGVLEHFISLTQFLEADLGLGSLLTSG